MSLASIGAASAADIGTDAPVEATFANGLHVVLLPDRLAPVAVSVMIYGVGSADEPAPGIAHATEHMLFRGTQALSAQQLASIAARMGAEYNANTSEQSTLYYYKFPAAYAPIAIRIEADRMTNALIADADWSTERGAIEQEVRADESRPGFTIGLKLRSLFFNGTPLAHSALGTLPSFDAMQASDIRAFYKRWYEPNNATFVLAGDIDPTATLAQLHASFDGIAAGEPPVHTPILVPSLGTSQIKESIDFPIGLGVFAYRLPGAHDPDYTASLVLGEALKSNRSSFTQLTTSGSVLGILEMSSAYRELGALYMLALPAQNDSVDHALALTGTALEAYRTNGIPPDLVEAAKAKLISADASREASISGLTWDWASAMITGAPSPPSAGKALRAVSADDVNRILRSYASTAHELSMVLTSKPTTTKTAGGTTGASGEHVGVVPTTETKALPPWAAVAFAAPLRAPTTMEAARRPKRLANGLRYTLLRESIAPTVTIRGVIRTSPSLYVPKGKDGLSDVLNGLIGWGTSTSTLDEYEHAFDAIAATHVLASEFTVTVPAEHFEDAVALLADGLLHPRFDPESLVVMKSKIAQSVKAARGFPKVQAARAQALALYGRGDPRLRVATEATVASITMNDVRAYYATSFRPDVTQIAVVGDITPERVDAAFAKAFGGWARHGNPPSFRFPNVAGPRAASTVVVKSQSVTEAETELRETFAMRRTDPDYVPLQLANTILAGEGTGSLLMQELRTRLGYVYSVASTFAVDQSGARFSVSFATTPANARKADAAAVALIRGLQDRTLPVVELQKAKALLLAQRVLPLDSYDGLAKDILQGAADGYDGDETRFWNALLTTTPTQLQHAMRRIDTHRLVRVTLEPES